MQCAVVRFGRISCLSGKLYLYGFYFEGLVEVQISFQFMFQETGFKLVVEYCWLCFVNFLSCTVLHFLYCYLDHK